MLVVIPEGSAFQTRDRPAPEQQPWLGAWTSAPGP